MKSQKYRAVEARLSQDVLDSYSKIKYCPVCAKELEINPLSGHKACFADGDLQISGLSIVWRPLH